MQRPSEPGTGISIVQSSGTSTHPNARAASAGNSLLTSGVVVKIALTTSEGSSPFSVAIAARSSRVAAWISSGVSRSTVVAPRMARRRSSLIR